MANVSIIQGCGGYVPQKCVTNEELSLTVETSHEWIFTRTGIVSRHIAAEEEATSDLAANAAKAALENAGIEAKDIDLIICATTTPDKTFPSTAVYIQKLLGVPPCSIAFDIQAVCSGFVYALATADLFLKGGMAKRALVIGAEVFSRLLDWTDRATCVLFGDGAGAVVLEAVPEECAKGRGIIESALHADGTYASILESTGGPSSTKTVGVVSMQGREVYRHAVEKMVASIQDTLQKQNLTPQDIDWLIPHQANRRILESVAEKLQIPAEKVIITVQDHANTSAASIPLALWEGVKRGCFKEHDLIVLEAMGAGLTWGTILLRW